MRRRHVGVVVHARQDNLVASMEKGADAARHGKGQACHVLVERFNGRIEDVLQSHNFDSGEDLEQTIHRYVRLYNGQLPQSALKGQTPIDTLKDWHRQKPNLFKKRPYNHAGCDNCAYARGFLDHLAQRNIPVADATEAQVEHYLREAVALFQRRHGRLPGPRWHQIPCAGIHALLRLVQGRWPPAPNAACAADALRFTICDEYEAWLLDERGLARPSIDALLWEARHFLAWHFERCGAECLVDLSVDDIDRYMDLRALKLTRSSLKSVAERPAGQWHE